MRSAPLIVCIAMWVCAGAGPGAGADPTEQPPAPAGYWRDEPRDPVLRHIPSAVGLSDREEADCSGYRNLFLGQFQQSEYNRCTVATKRRETAIATEDDAICKSYGLVFGTAAYAQCRENRANQRSADRRAIITSPAFRQ